MDNRPGDGWLNQPTSQRFDRRLCLDTLENARRAIEQITARTNFHYSVTFKDAKSGGRSASLESLKAITFQELVIDSVHRGRVLYGRLCANPLLLAAVHTVLEDERGDGVLLFIYNAVPSTASLEETEAHFPKGMKVAIKEPHFKWAADGRASIRVDNPANVVRVPNCQDIIGGRNAMDQATVVELLQAIRCEGNKLFGKQNWFGAVAKYSECIDEGKAFEDQGSCGSERFNDVMKLAYSNRAEALLRLRNFHGALSDAEKALELDPTLTKSLDRLARAAMGMGLHDMATEASMALLKQCPDEILRIEALWSREVEESRPGNHSFKMSHLPEHAMAKVCGVCRSSGDPSGQLRWWQKRSVCNGSNQNIYRHSHEQRYGGGHG